MPKDYESARNFFMFFVAAHSAGQKGRDQHATIKGTVGTVKNMACHWPMLKLALSLVNADVRGQLHS